ncbi:MAG: hypothetical protein IH606_18185 [Burkholderiales bacterium]|nr:hypothetical protein [Burkholderiales bacterium]
MKRINFRKAMGAAVLTGGVIFAGSAMAQTQGAYGHGPGMMGGYQNLPNKMEGQ